jgi:ribosomal protein S6--L-glutamate ligase
MGPGTEKLDQGRKDGKTTGVLGIAVKMRAPQKTVLQYTDLAPSKNGFMILSFHPNIIGDKNILCAGRAPNETDETAISKADAVILPQGPSEMLYRMCRQHCAHVFPNYDIRFDFPGKLGQAKLFGKADVAFPATQGFPSVSAFRQIHGGRSPLPYPCVFKSDWGGEGEGIFLLESDQALSACLQRAKRFEPGGQKGFLLQEFIPHRGRTLRVVVIGDNLFSYWRRQEEHTEFRTNLKSGAVIDQESDRQQQDAGKDAVRAFCGKTGLNLAGLDLLFNEKDNKMCPLFLEINYYFGRQGLGGSMRYYDLFEKAVARWLDAIGLSL